MAQKTDQPETPIAPPSNRRYWAGGFLWRGNEYENHLDEFVSGNFWRLGWNRDSSDRSAKATWKVYDQINIGDEFAIKGYGGRNDVRIYYIGIVKSKVPEQGKLLLKKLDRPLAHGKKPKGAGTGNWFNTLVDIRAPEMIKWAFHVEDNPVSPPLIADNALNQILYGPPGTGKTYSAIERAVKMIDIEDAEDYKASKERWDELRYEGRIEFVTFHQSYGYEDFVEGLRPVVESESGRTDEGIARYEVRPGALKNIALRALESILEPASVEAEITQAEGVPRAVLFDELWDAFLNNISNEPNKLYYVTNGNAKFEMRRSPHGGVKGNNKATKPNQTHWPYACGKPNAKRVWDVLENKETPTLKDVQDVIRVGAQFTFILAVLIALQKLRNAIQRSGESELIEQPSASSGEEGGTALQFLKAGEDSGYRIIPDRSKWPRYVLVIDEINRGNISKIFGELITLLEDDKRIGNEHALTATLPYSQDPFGLPANLHILGTMNTADKSIALVDIALRRRFDFEELRPDFSVCLGLSEDMRQVLKRLNERILLRKDRDHRLGHAFFMSVKEGKADTFNAIFERKILPLLGEYFYGDWDGLRAVLGESGDDEGFVRKIKTTDSGLRGPRNTWQWYFDGDDYERADKDAPFDSLATLMKNYKLPKSNAASSSSDSDSGHAV